MSVAQWLARWRVRLGYLLAVLVLWASRPVLRSILCGAILGAIGLFVRARAAGYLHKQQVLTMTGPYAYTRNPLYLGSAILALGVAVAAHSWIAAAILLGYFAVVYSVVVRREEQELRQHYGAAFDEYARTVPLFLPRLTAAKLSAASAGFFSFGQYKKNQEYRAAIGFLLVLIVFFVIWRLRLP
jgi:protein-S-isoprenylcysteine O-methyltransferase Ste14